MPHGVEAEQSAAEGLGHRVGAERETTSATSSNVELPDSTRVTATRVVAHASPPPSVESVSLIASLTASLISDRSLHPSSPTHSPRTPRHDENSRSLSLFRNASGRLSGR